MVGYINAIEDRLHRMEAIVGGLVDADGKESSAGSNGSAAGIIGTGGMNGKLKRRKSKGSAKPDGESANAQEPQAHLLHIAPDLAGHRRQTPGLPGFQSSPEHNSQQPQVPQQQQPQPSLLQQHPVHPGYINHQPPPGLRLDSSQSPEVLPTSQASGEGYSPLHRDHLRENTSFSTPSPVLSSQHSVGETGDTAPKIESSCHHMQQRVCGTEMDDLEDDMGHLTLDRVGQERYVGKSSPMWYNERHYGGVCDTLVPVRPAAAKFVENLDLPSPEVMSHLINLHLKHVHPFAPVFIWSKFLRRLQAGDYDPSFLLLLNALFALASRFSDDVSLRTDPTKPETAGLQFVQNAKAILDIVYDTSDTTIIAGLVLLSYQRVGTGGGWAAWMFVGLAIRMAQHVGLNRDPTKLNRNMHPLIREERNRIWWSLVMADRFISACFGRPQGIHEHDCDAPYPEGIDDENAPLEFKLPGATTVLTGPTPGSEKNFVYMASLIRILGRVMTNLYSPNAKASSLSSSSMTNSAPLEQLDKELTDWLLTLPPHLQFRSVQQEPGNFVCTLHMTFYATLILLHRPYAHYSKHRTGNDPSISLSICTSAANNAIEIASSLNKAQSSPLPGSRTRLKYMFNYISFIIFTAGVVHVNNCTSLDPGLAAMAKIRTVETLAVLDGVKDVWITGYWCCNNLKRLVKLRNIELPIPIESSGSGSIAEGITPSPSNPSVLYSNIQESEAAVQQSVDPGLFTTAANDPFGVPGSATLSTGVSQPPLQGQIVSEQPMSESPLTAIQNPFSSSLWSIPTSMDNEEWMLYMQNAQNGQAVDGMQTPNDTTAESPVTSESLFRLSPSAAVSPLPASPMVGANVALTATAGTIHANRNVHPLAQSLTSQDLDGTFHNHMSLAAAATANSSATTVQYDPHLIQAAQPAPPPQPLQQHQQPQPQQTTLSQPVAVTGAVGFAHNPLTNPVIPQPPLRSQQTTNVPSEYDFFLGNIANLGVQQQQPVQQAQ
ncbi:hypothetical protein BGW42_004782 [Actinomortierella wolfii]|nr:hypothetical protein BGW42_004782 [Actinomortierella wolfii]